MYWLMAFVVALLLAGVWGCGLPSAYRDRACQGRAWKRQFPGADKHAIRAFLGVFCGAFAFSETHRLAFGPDDELLAIYRALYPSKLLPDNCELEVLQEDLRKQYDISLEAVWHERLTLGEPFGAAISRRTMA